MKDGVFRAGVRPGSPASTDEIKMLLCYLIHMIGDGISFEQLHEVLTEGYLVNYFELVQAIDALIKTNHIVSSGDKNRSDTYSLTGIGVSAVTEFEKTLPLTVRENALRAAEGVLRRIRLEHELIIDIRKADTGYIMELAIPEMGGSLISFTLFLMSREQCEEIRRRFINDPVFIYKGVLGLLTGDKNIMGELLHPRQM